MPRRRNYKWGKKKALGHAHGKVVPTAVALARAWQERDQAQDDRATAALEFERERRLAQQQIQHQQQLLHQQQQQILQFQQQQHQIQPAATANALVAAADQIQAARGLLDDPVSLELLDDPVSTPCCGNAFSRASLRGVLGAHAACPLCRADIAARFPAFDVETVPKNRTIAAMVDVHAGLKKLGVSVIIT